MERTPIEAGNNPESDAINQVAEGIKEHISNTPLDQISEQDLHRDLEWAAENNQQELADELNSKLNEKLNSKNKTQEDLISEIDDASDLGNEKAISPAEIELMALEATEEETREAVVEELPPEEKAEAVEVMKEIEEMSPEEKEKVALGLNNIGFFVEEKKNNLFASAFNKASSVGNEKGTVSRFAGALRDSFLKDAETARQKSIDSNNGKTRKVGNAMSLFGNVLKYARIVSDLTTKSLVSPLRYVMMAGASVARVADAGKEARLQNEEVIDKTRIADSLKAEEEAWKIYENAEAKNTGKKLSAEDLKKSYMDQMPKDLLERIGRDSSIESSFANRIVQSVIKKDIEGSIQRLNNSIDKIENDPNLSDEEKESKKQNLLNKQKSNLLDYDRIITQYGTVDSIAMVARYSKVAGKTAVAAVSVETLGLSLEHLWENLSHVLTHSDSHEVIKAGSAIVGHSNAPKISIDTLTHSDTSKIGMPAVEDHTNMAGTVSVEDGPDGNTEGLQGGDIAGEKARMAAEIAQRKAEAVMSAKIASIESQLDSHPLEIADTPSIESDALIDQQIFENNLDADHTTVGQLMNKIGDTSASRPDVMAALEMDKLNPTPAEWDQTIKQFAENRFGDAHVEVPTPAVHDFNPLQGVDEHINGLMNETNSILHMDGAPTVHADSIEPKLEGLEGGNIEAANEFNPPVDNVESQTFDGLEGGDIASAKAEAIQNPEPPKLSFWDKLVGNMPSPKTVAEVGAVATGAGLGVYGAYKAYNTLEKLRENADKIKTKDLEKMSDKEKLDSIKNMTPEERRLQIGTLLDTKKANKQDKLNVHLPEDFDRLINNEKPPNYKEAFEMLLRNWRSLPKGSPTRNNIDLVIMATGSTNPVAMAEARKYREIIKAEEKK